MDTPPRIARLPTARIVRRQDCTDDLFLLWLEPSIEFRFAPGQYITIGAGGIERPFSIASAPHEPNIELFVEYVFPEHGGHLTPLLYAQHVGEMLTMRPKAKGRFTRRAGVTNHVMVATVTGIAPYVSMIRQFIHDRETRSDAPEQSRFFVMQGASHRDELVYDTELMTLSTSTPRPGPIRLQCEPAMGRAECGLDRANRPHQPAHRGVPGPLGFAEGRYAHLLVR